MAFEFHIRAAKPGGRIALFPGTWNPPTVAHLAMAHAALASADEVVLVLPRHLPHKTFAGVAFHDRLALLTQLAYQDPHFSAATSSGGLYLEIAQQARQALGSEPEIALLCGRDAAERIAAWDYGREGVFAETIAEFPLLVAARRGAYEAPAEHLSRIGALPMQFSFDEVSSTEVRERIAARAAWRHLVPPALHDAVIRLYG